MCLSRKEETEAGTRPHPVVAPVHNAAGTIAMAHLSSPTVLPALGLPVPSWTLNPARAAMSHLLLLPLGHSFQVALGRKQRMPH